MKKSVRLISAILTVLMFLGSVVVVGAADKAAGVDDYLTYLFPSEQSKLASMKEEYSLNGFTLYCDEYTGEIALLKESTGQVLFSNPYDIADSNSANSSDRKAELMSQLIVYYYSWEEFDSNTSPSTMTTYTDAVLQGDGAQIKVERIRNGIRVEYTIGREEPRRLIPRIIRKDRFEDEILSHITNDFERGKAKSYYQLYDPFDTNQPSDFIAEMKATYPITAKGDGMAIYVCDPSIDYAEENLLESYIKKYCPDYTYETLDQDHEITEYEGSADKAPPLFRIALEYTIDENGLNVRLPANGIRYDDTAYILRYIDILPYMGAIDSYKEGYSFIPDGSGAIVEANKLREQGVNGWTRDCPIYSNDYAYQQFTDAVTNPQEDTRFAVWGAVTNAGTVSVDGDIIKPEETVTDPETGEETTIPAEYEQLTLNNKKGYVAMMTEGESLASIRYNYGGTSHKYATTYVRVTPRPMDTYNLSESISAADNAEWPVVTPRKYTGGYSIKYVMLDGKEVADFNGVDDYYEASYFGMAKAYRDYLESSGVLTRLTEADVEEQMPLYIELLGTLETSERILSIPVTVDTPLTTFEDIQTIYEDLVNNEDYKISNVNFKLLGFANGGLSDPTVPYNVKWEKAVGGNSGFEALMEYAKDKSMGIYPDFDFVYAPNNKWFDGFSYSKHAVKTIDDRYTSKRYYDATIQNYTRNFEIAISASVFSYFFDHFADAYDKFSPTGISVATLGTDLNSDFDEDEPYNREDSKQFTVNLLEDIGDKYNVMVDAGNAYTYKYVDHIVNMKFESSRYYNASYSVPFNGLVLHGYLNIAGEPINEEGDIEAALLRAIESGSYLNFIFAYRNIEKLKQDYYLNKYYSVRYDIWFADMIEYYAKVNDAIGDLQTALITGHEFLNGERVPDPDEKEADEIALAEYEAFLKEYKEELERKEAAAKALAARKSVGLTAEMITEMESCISAIAEQRDKLNDVIAQLAALQPEIADVKAPYEAAVAKVTAAENALAAAKAALEASEDEDKTALEDDVKAKEQLLKDAQANLAEPKQALADKLDELGYNKIYKKGTAAAASASKSAERAAEILLEAEELVAISADYEEYAASVKANAATIASKYSQVETLITAVNNAVDTTLKAYSYIDEEEEPADDPTDDPADSPADDTADLPADDATEAPADDTVDDTAADNADDQIAVRANEPDEDQVDDPADEPAEEPTDEPTDEPADEPTDDFNVEEALEEYKQKKQANYAVADGSIVHVTYETGKSFILNYNSFTVMVTLNGQQYTIEPYDFIIISK